MNYCIVAFGIILIISVVQWFVDGRRNYKGPYVDPEVLEQADTDFVGVGLTSEQSHLSNGGGGH